jgi:hypothetical protein
MMFSTILTQTINMRNNGNVIVNATATIIFVESVAVAKRQ